MSSNPNQNKKPNLCGISNLGNTCYMNTLLQCLKNCEAFENVISNTVGDQDSKLFNDIKDVYTKMSQHPGKIMAPKRLVYILSRIMTSEEFLVHSQNDIHEFYLFIINHLLDEIGKKYINNEADRSILTAMLQNDVYKGMLLDNEINKESLLSMTNNFVNQSYNGLMMQALYGQMMTYIHCANTQCQANHYSFQPFNSIEASISDPELTGCLENHFQEELMNSQDNKDLVWTCDKCGTNPVNSKKRLLIWKSPNVLVIALKRYYFDKRGRKYKINSPVNFENTLPVKTMNETVKYKLKSIGLHTGVLQGGHYYSVVNVDNQQYTVNDSQIDKTSDIDKQNVYVLFYEK
jgi:ubiquitin C-terminal hydrolase